MRSGLRFFLLAILVATSAALAQNASDPPVAIDFKSKTLSWSPCPPFMPAGCELAVLHGDPAQENVDVFFKVPGDSAIPSHYHTSVERMVLVSGELHVTYEGRPKMTLKPGMYAYGPAKLPHEAHCAKGDPCVLFIAFEEPLDAVPVEPAPKHASLMGAPGL